jgi:hypothetical protein
MPYFQKMYAAAIDSDYQIFISLLEEGACIDERERRYAFTTSLS